MLTNRIAMIKSTPNNVLQKLEERHIPLRHAILSLKQIGLNPLEKTKINLLKRFIYATSIIVPFMLLFWSIVEERGNVRYLSMDVYSPTQRVLFKFLFILYLRKNMGNLIENVIASWPDDVFGEKLQSEIQKTKDDYNRFYKKYKTVIVVTSIIYLIKGPASLYTEPLFIWYQPFDSDNRKMMILNVIYQQYSIVVIAYSLLAYDVLFFALMSHCYIQFQAIKHGFKHLNYDQDEEVLYRKFSEIVKHHVFMLRTVNDINKIFSKQFLNHFFTVVISMCCGIFLLNMDGFPPTTESILTYIPYLTTYHFQLYLYCATGQEIAEQGESVSMSIYESNWYISHRKTLSKPIRMVMNITNIPNKLTIGGFWFLNLRTFMLVIKTSVSFNAFMQTVYKKK